MTRRAARRRSTTTSTRCSRRARRAPAAPMDKSLVAGVRDMLARYPLEYRIFSRLKRQQRRRRHPGVHRRRRRRAAGAAGVRARERRAADQGHAGPVHPRRLSTRRSSGRSSRRPRSWRPRKAGCSACARPSRQAAADRPRRRSGADEPGAAPVLRGVHQGLGQVHRRRARWSSSSGLEQSLQVARVLSAVDSPLAAFLRGVAARDDAGARRRRPPGVDSGTRDRPARPEGRRRRSASSRAVLGKVKVPGRGGAGRRGPPLEQMVDDHFAPIHRLVAGPAGADRRDPQALQRGLRAARRASTRRRRASRRRRPAAAPSASRRRPGSCPSRSARCSRSWPAPRRPPGRAVEREGLTSELKPITDFCNRAITGRYPFTASSKADVLPEDFAPAVRRRRPARRLLPAQAGEPRSTPARNPWSFKPTGDGTQPGQRRRRWPTSSAPRASRKCSSAAAARRRRSRSTSARSRWTTG